MSVSVSVRVCVCVCVCGSGKKVTRCPQVSKGVKEAIHNELPLAMMVKDDTSRT